MIPIVPVAGLQSEHTAGWLMMVWGLAGGAIMTSMLAKALAPLASITVSVTV